MRNTRERNRKLGRIQENREKLLKKKDVEDNKILK